MMSFMDGFKMAQENKKKSEESKKKGLEVVNNQNYKEEAYIADVVYKSFVTDGASRLDKVNGRLLASLNMKMDTVIDQNNRIIELLDIISKK